MSKPDTSRAAVQTLASHWHGEYIYDLLNALVDERDAALYMERNLAHALGEARAEVAAFRAEVAAFRAALRAASLDMLAANDAPLLDAEAAFAAGAEAMRRAAQDACQAAFQPAPAMDATAVNAVRAGVALCVATIRALPLPKMEDKTND
jgi:hypothetical protein